MQKFQEKLESGDYVKISRDIQMNMGRGAPTEDDIQMNKKAFEQSLLRS